MGMEVKIDINNCDWMPSHWKHYKPVYSYSEDPDCLSGVEWHSIEKTKLRWNRFSLIQKYEKDCA